MAKKDSKITCCKGKYHILLDGQYYCMKPPNVECAQALKDVGKFTRGQKKILYCVHRQGPCEQCHIHATPDGPDKERA